MFARQKYYYIPHFCGFLNARVHSILIVLKKQVYPRKVCSTTPNKVLKVLVMTVQFICPRYYVPDIPFKGFSVCGKVSTFVGVCKT